MGIIKKTFSLCKCERCSYEWIPNNIRDLPTMCASCNSPYWNKPRKNKKSPSPIKQPVKLPTRGRGGSFQTSASSDNPRTRPPVKRIVPRRPTQREIDSAGIGGAT